MENAVKYNTVTQVVKIMAENVQKLNRYNMH